MNPQADESDSIGSETQPTHLPGTENMRQTTIILFTLLMSALSVAATAADKPKDPNKGIAWSSGEGGTRASASGGQNEIQTDDAAGNAQAAAGKPKPKPKPSGSGEGLPTEEISMNY